MVALAGLTGSARLFRPLPFLSTSQHAMCDLRTAESCAPRSCVASTPSSASAVRDSSPSKYSGSSIGPGGGEVGERKGGGKIVAVVAVTSPSR